MGCTLWTQSDTIPCLSVCCPSVDGVMDSSAKRFRIKLLSTFLFYLKSALLLLFSIFKQMMTSRVVKFILLIMVILIDAYSI